MFSKKIFTLCLCFFSLHRLLFSHEISDHWEGEQYIKNSTLQYQWASSYIKKLHIAKNETILDIGCGDGRITTLLAKAAYNGKVLGIDISDSMLIEAKKILQMSSLKNLDFTKTDIATLNYKNEFDLIVSFSCFHWVNDHQIALKKIEKALKPGGRVFLYFAPDHGRDRFDHAISTTMASQKWMHYFKNYSNPFSLSTPSKFATYAEKAHLLIKRIEIITIDEIFNSKEAFIAWITAWLPNLKHIPESSHQEFLEEIIDCYLKKHPIDAKGNIHFIDYWMEAEFIKSSLSVKNVE